MAGDERVICHPQRELEEDPDATLSRLLNSTACNVSVGVILLLMGVIVTSMTFRQFNSTNKVILLGPILVGAGVLGIGKALLKKYHYGGVEQDASARDSGAGRGGRRCRRGRIRGLRAQRPATQCTAQASTCQPPPYEVLIPSETVPSTPADTRVLALPGYSELDPLPPPPKYDEVFLGIVEEDSTQSVPKTQGHQHPIPSSSSADTQSTTDSSDHTEVHMDNMNLLNNSLLEPQGANDVSEVNTDTTILLHQNRNNNSLLVSQRANDVSEVNTDTTLLHQNSNNILLEPQQASDIS